MTLGPHIITNYSQNVDILQNHKKYFASAVNRTRGPSSSLVATTVIIISFGVIRNLRSVTNRILLFQLSIESMS